MELRTCEHLEKVKPEFVWVRTETNIEQEQSINICGIYQRKRVIVGKKRKVK